MSENANVPENPTSTPEAKGKIKKMLPVAAVVVVLLVIITSCFGGGGSGKSVNKEAIKLLQKHNPSKILAIMPEGYEEAVMDYYKAYVTDKKQLKEAVKQETASAFDNIGKVKKMKFKENFAIDLKDLSGSGLNMEEEAAVKEFLNGIGYIWKELNDCDEGYVTIVEITYKKEDGEKETQDTLLCSFKYKGKWYCMNAMSAVYHAAWGYSPSKRGK
ncbi:MAG: hypothetical protein K2J40_03550 [Ruminococcus sp.]|nr:hypothetical protein [Ruminococcus sp.]